MKNGTIILPQSLVGTLLWQDMALWRLWSWCLLRAARRARVAAVGGVSLRLAAGELAATPADIALATGLSPSELRRCLALGKKLGRLDVRSTPWALRLVVVNWQEYRRPLPERAFGAGR